VAVGIERRELRGAPAAAALAYPQVLFMARVVRAREGQTRGLCPRLGKREGFSFLMFA